MCRIWSQVTIQWTLIFIIKVTFYLILWACIIAAQSGDPAGVPEISRYLPQACWSRLASTKRQNCTQLAKTPSQWRWASTPAHSEKQHRPGWDPTQSLWALLRGGGVGRAGHWNPQQWRQGAETMAQSSSLLSHSDFLVIRKRWEGRVTGHRLRWSSPFCLFLVLLTQPVFRCGFRFTCLIGSSLGSFSAQFHDSNSENSSDNCFFIVSPPYFPMRAYSVFPVTSESGSLPFLKFDMISWDISSGASNLPSLISAFNL